MTPRRIMVLTAWAFIAFTVGFILIGGAQGKINQDSAAYTSLSTKEAQLQATVALSTAIAAEQQAINKRLQRDLPERYRNAGPLSDIHRLLHDEFFTASKRSRILITDYELHTDNSLVVTYHGSENGSIAMLQWVDKMSLPIAPSSITISAIGPHIVETKLVGTFLGGPLHD
jgi:hypothetical protein